MALQSIGGWVKRLARLICTVRVSGRVAISSGQRKSLQCVSRSSSTTVASAGRIAGSAIVQYWRKAPAPSSAAASSSAAGSSRKCWRRK
jgi:hypothetical protein